MGLMQAKRKLFETLPGDVFNFVLPGRQLRQSGQTQTYGPPATPPPEFDTLVLGPLTNGNSTTGRRLLQNTVQLTFYALCGPCPCSIMMPPPKGREPIALLVLRHCIDAVLSRRSTSAVYFCDTC
jgi:hypothetical protein